MVKGEVRKPEPASRRAGKALRQMEKDGGLRLSCGCFMSTSVKEMRILLVKVGPTEMMAALDQLETDHECQAGSQGEA